MALSCDMRGTGEIGGRASQKTISPMLCEGEIGMRYYDFAQEGEISGESHFFAARSAKKQNLNSICAEGHFLACS